MTKSRRFLDSPRQSVELYFARSAVPWKSADRIADSSSRNAVSFSSASTTNASRRRDVRRQSRSFARWNQSLRHAAHVVALGRFSNMGFLATMARLNYQRLLTPTTLSFSNISPLR